MSYDSKGASLVEIILVIFIVGLLSSLSISSFSPLWKKQQLKNAANDIRGQIQMLRMEAILKSQTRRMKISASTLIVEHKVANKWKLDRQISIPPDVVVSFSGYLYFHKRGFTSPKTIKLQRSNFKKSLVVNINGRTRESEIH